MKQASRVRSGATSTAPRTGWGPALSAGLLWAAAGLTAGYWVLLVWGRSPDTPVEALPVPAAVSDTAAVARALGAAPAAQAAPAAPVDASARYRLLGVVVQPGGQGSALIATDGHPPRPYRVGAALEEGLVLLSVDRTVVRLGAAAGAPATIELRLPVAPAP